MGVTIKGVENVDVNHERFLVARYDKKTKKLWYWDSWDDKKAAERVAQQFDTGVVVDMEEGRTMTNKEAATIISKLGINTIAIAKDKISDGCYTKNDIDVAKDMAIKALEQEPILEKIKSIVAEWKADTWTDNLSYECMVKIAKLVEPQESGDKDK